MSLADKFKNEMDSQKLLQQIESMMETLQSHSKEQNDRLMEQHKMGMELMSQLTGLMITQQKSMELMMNKIFQLEKENSSKTKNEKMNLEENDNVKKQEDVTSKGSNVDSVEVNKSEVKKEIVMVKDHEEVRVVIGKLCKKRVLKSGKEVLQEIDWEQIPEYRQVELKKQAQFAPFF